jgi:hypothetical protein
MWRAHHTIPLLELCQENDVIAEVILIDNDPSKRNPEISRFSKVVHLPQKENLFVNPSWNFGVSVSRNDKLCICNDDCLVNFNFLKDFEQHITSDSGLFGFSERSFLHDRSDNLQPFYEYKSKGFGDKLSFTESPTSQPHIAYGVCMFVHKSSWHVIPEDFKVDHGDGFNYILNKFKYNKKNYLLDLGLVMTKMSCTGLDFGDEKEKERKVFFDVFKRYGLG